MRSSIRGATGAYRRTVVLGAASIALLLTGLGPATGAPIAPEQETAFSNGIAKATAQVAKIGPGVGSLELALGSGIAVSELKNQLAQSQAQSFDLGLIGTTLTAESCGGAAALTPDQLPQPTRVDNRKGTTRAETDEVPLAGSNLGAGRELAEATEAPSARAVATTLASAGDAFSLSGGQATAVTEVLDGAARQAHATVDVDLTIAGLVQLSGLRWDATHRTGSEPMATGTFDIGTATLAGVPIPLESLTQVESVINTALAQTGITIQFPRVERFETPTDLVRVTPLRVTLRDSPAGKATLGPGLNASRAQREQLFNELSAAVCQAAGALLVGDIGVSIASGTGFLVYEIGGAEAISGDFVVENPFGEAIAPVVGAPVAPAGGFASGPGTPALTPAAAPAAPGASTEGTQRAASIGPLEELCESVHPFSSRSCSEGALAPLGLIGLVATGAVAGLDWRHQRRRASKAAAGALA